MNGLQLSAAITSGISALIALTGGIVSVVFWFRARDERKEAARQALAATEAAKTVADSAKALTELRIGQERRAQSQIEAEERDPWRIWPSSTGAADLVNNTKTGKFNIYVKVTVEDQVVSEQEIDFVGPGNSRKITFLSNINRCQAEVTWHLDKDGVDEPRRQIL